MHEFVLWIQILFCDFAKPTENYDISSNVCGCVSRYVWKAKVGSTYMQKCLSLGNIGAEEFYGFIRLFQER